MADAHTSVATLLATRFIVQTGDRVRITFGEGHADGDHFHQAVSLSRADALELAALVARLVLHPDDPGAAAETTTT